MKFFSAIGNFWSQLRKRRRYSHVIAPQNIGDEAQKLIHLVELSLRNGYLSGAEAHHLQTLQEEMGRLITLTEKDEFHRLSVERRLSLHDSLLRSQEKLLVTIHGADAPTERMQ